MSVDHHTPITYGAPAASSVLNAPLGQLDAAITARLPMVDARDHGLVVDGSTDDGPAINTALGALPATGGVVLLPVGIMAIATTIDMREMPNVTLRGAGCKHDVYGGTLTEGTVLKWTGSAGGTVLAMGAVSAASAVPGTNVMDLAIHGQSGAATGILVQSLWWGQLRNLHIQDCTTVALDITTVDLSGTETTQGCLFEQISVRQGTGSPSGIGIRLRSHAAGGGNPSLNTFVQIQVRTYNGTSIELNDSDGNRFYGVETGAGGTGLGIDLKGQVSGAVGHCRSNAFFYVEAPNGVTARGTGLSAPAVKNAIWFYNLENGGAVPTIESGATLAYSTNTGITRQLNGGEIRSGSGSPEGAVTAPVGSLYLRTNGGANTTLWIKESGSSSTGWAAK